MPPTAQSPPRFVFGILFLLGLVGTGVFGYVQIWLPLRANLFYAETTCVVLDKRLAEQNGEGGKSYRPEIHIEYAVEGVKQRVRTYDATGDWSDARAAQQRTLEQFQVGGQYPCWFDPAKPDRAVLTRRFTWGCLIVLIPMLFMGIGAVGWMRKLPLAPPLKPVELSATERRMGCWLLGVFFGGFLAAAAVSAVLIFTFGGFGQPFWLLALMFFGPFLVFIGLLSLVATKFLARHRRTLPSPEKAATRKPDAVPADDLPPVAYPAEWPTVPTLDPTPPPGRWLRYRLMTNTRPGVLLAAMSGAALFWNGIVSVFLFQMIEGHRQGQPNWIMTVFLVPFVLFGLVLIGVVSKAAFQFATSLLVGRIGVEIADYSLRPGRAYAFLVEQSGTFRLGRVSLVLTCTESATYTAGTSTRTETKEVRKHEVAQAEAMPLEGLRGTLTVPGDAMHSFESDHNKITWTLRVKGRVGLLPYVSEYPVLVLPASEGVSS